MNGGRPTGVSSDVDGGCLPPGNPFLTPRHFSAKKTR